MPRPNRKDLTGQPFDRWTVLREAAPIRKNERIIRLWLCRCECGTERIVKQQSLESKRSKSCGCYSRDYQAQKHTTHGQSKNPGYVSWKSARDRCSNPNGVGAKHYFERGIKMCERWRNSCFEFLKDLGPCPAGKSIERIEVNGHYSCGQCDECKQNGWPMNCEWRTMKEQCRNKTNNTIYTVQDKTDCLAALCDHFNIRYGTVCERIRLGWPIEKALTYPVKKMAARLIKTSLP